MGKYQKLSPNCPMFSALFESRLRSDYFICNCRCDIPVIVMGETGCGKTRLIRYMCDLARQGMAMKNLLILKVLEPVVSPAFLFSVHLYVIQWTLVNPDRVNPKPRKSEVQNQLINLGVKVMFCA